MVSNWLHTLGPEWTAALALSIQAVIFVLQAVFLWWQARILRRHASTLEKNTEIIGRQATTLLGLTRIANAQAETLRLIAQALNQQGDIQVEQTTIMRDQLKFITEVDGRSEKSNLLNLLVEVQTSLRGLASTLSNFQPPTVPTLADRHDVECRFEGLSIAVTECEKALLTAVHISDAQREFFSDYCHDVATLDPTGNAVQEFVDVHAVSTKHPDSTFFMQLGSLGKLPRVADSPIVES
jgi:hypothetical protein